MNIDLEIYVAGAWHPAASFLIAEQTVAHGHQGQGVLSYSGAYALAHYEAADARALSCRYPVGIEHWRAGWPAFLLDLMPTGYGRQKLLAGLGIAPAGDGPHRDVEVLLTGAGNPIGNVRVAQAAAGMLAALAGIKGHAGFTKAQVMQRDERFLEYAESYGMIVAGESGVSGESPKMLIVEDRNGRWHADGAVDDARVLGHYIVKFDRGRDADDRLIVENEAPYLEVARELGLRVGAPIEFATNTLLIPRFDRRLAGQAVFRLGMESLYAAAGIAAIGADAKHETFCEVISRVCDDPQADIEEYVLRDVLNIALGNKDNHGRNTALLKDVDGSVRLSPMFDFCPMYKSNSVITRRTRWTNDAGGSPDWNEVAQTLAAMRVDPKALRNRLRGFGRKLEGVAGIMRAKGVADRIIEERARSIEEQAGRLKMVTGEGVA